MKTDFSISLDIVRPNGSRGGEGSGADTLADAIGKAVASAAYYVGLGYRVTADIRERCAACGGRGEVPRKRAARFCTFKRCPDCKGRSDGMQSLSFPIDFESNYRSGLEVR